MPESADRILRRAGRHGPAGAALESGGRGIAASVHETPENRWVGWGENLRPLKRTPTPADISSRRVMHAVGRASTRLAVIAAMACGCVSLPPAALRPARLYPPEIEHLSISGFRRSEWRQTGAASVYVSGPHVDGGGGARWGEYVGVTDAPTFRRLLEDTGCARIVEENANGPLRIDGASDGRYVHGWNTAVIILEAFTATPIFGMPLPGVAEGSASARLYRDGRFVREYGATRRLRYWTTAYSWRRDQPTAIHYARVMALRQLADEVAADLCGGRRLGATR